uniref:DUF3164 family protein n=1 Tax=Candidatus Kentrum sp. UNK TaxID=2126344 RepID=A0A450ZYU2_9GAMM|nr:MAG: Protein of unknown function (DUF3164) [Candidatus Kentron sp. UNK]VFK68640.1 MAG: Protein of unknown function (DUF3164) [Candidatus Kentron sp. UNK]
MPQGNLQTRDKNPEGYRRSQSGFLLPITMAPGQNPGKEDDIPEGCPRTPNRGKEDDTPAGYLRNPQRHLIPMEMVPPLEREKDELVRELTEAAKGLNRSIRAYKLRVMADVQAYLERSLARYGVKPRGAKGNLTLTSFNGALQIKISTANRVDFDERIQAVQALVYACLDEFTEGSRKEVKVLIEDAFRSNQDGIISSTRVLRLLRLDIDHPTWKAAMDALRDSIQVVSSKEYLRVYERDTNEESFRMIPLNVSDA